MPSLIVIHGVGDPSEADLQEATRGIAAAFSAVPEENRFFVNWNEAADRILQKEQFRWASVKRMFQALRYATEVGWSSARSDSRVDQFMNTGQRLLLGLNQICFAGVITVLVLIPAFGIVSVAHSAFLLEAPRLGSLSDFIDPRPFWPVPAPLVAQVWRTGLEASLASLRIIAAIWLAAAAGMLLLATAECVYHRSSAPLRVASRRVFLGLLGPILVLLLLPAYDFRHTITAIAVALVGPIVYIAGLFAFTFVLMLPFLFFQKSLMLIALQGFLYAIGMGLFSIAAVYLLARIRPGFGHVLKVLLDILLYTGDGTFREATHAALDNKVAASRERSPDGDFVIVGHSLGSVIALESLLGSAQWNKSASFTASLPNDLFKHEPELIVDLRQQAVRAADNARQHAPAGRASLDRLLPQRLLPPPGDHRCVELSG